MKELLKTVFYEKHVGLGAQMVEFGGWDIFEESVYDAAAHASVLKKDDYDLVKDELSEIKPWKAVFNNEYVKKLNGKLA